MDDQTEATIEALEPDETELEAELGDAGKGEAQGDGDVNAVDTTDLFGR